MLCKELYPYTKNTEIPIQYINTYYYWVFIKQCFIKTENPKHSYILWIKLKNAGGSFTYRNIDNEKLGKTAICINIANKYNDINELRRVIFHELQHCRESYAIIDKDVLRQNKTNIYADRTQTDAVHMMFKHILYQLSDAEQHARLQEIYDYVYSNEQITINDITSNELLSVSYINEFKVAISSLQYYTQEDLYKDPVFF